MDTPFWASVACIVGLAGAPVTALDFSVSRTPVDSLEKFFLEQQQNQMVELDLINGATIRGHYESYDADAERIWLLTPEDGRMFHQRSIRLNSIQSVRLASEPKALDALFQPAKDAGYELIGDELK